MNTQTKMTNIPYCNGCSGVNATLVCKNWNGRMWLQKTINEAHIRAYRNASSCFGIVYTATRDKILFDAICPFYVKK